MQVESQHYQTIWPGDDGQTVAIIDQTKLPYDFTIITLRSLLDTVRAIADMQVRGAPLIGVTAAWGLWLAMRNNPHDLNIAANTLIATRPTAVNLRYGVEKMVAVLEQTSPKNRAEVAYAQALEMTQADIQTNHKIADVGADLIESLTQDKKHKAGPINILTHCNAGWLATVDWGTALAPIYAAKRRAANVHVWVDETRPRNQGAFLTSWELGHEKIPHTVIADNAGGHLMANGQVDLCLVGADRVMANGDVYNKIGTYLKALAAKDCGVPFYVACPSTTIDSRSQPVVVEERDGDELRCLNGLNDQGQRVRLRIMDKTISVANPAFDRTPVDLVTGFVTEHGVVLPDVIAGLAQDQLG